MSAAPQTALRRTPLYERHAAAGAKLVPFAGWEMPVQYTSVREEHEAVRSTAGIFDVSHMGEVETTGADAERFLQHVLSNDLSKVAVGGAQYSVLCREDGGVLDDLFTYRLDEQRWLTVTNASNHESDLRWFVEHAEGFDVQVADVAPTTAMLAVQGPLARELVQAVADAPLPARMTAQTRRLDGAEAIVCGTGYTGEDGVEILCASEDAPRLWDQIVRRGATPCGLAARDTLRLEVGYHLYGNDLMIERGPIEAGLGWACKEETGFIGCDAVRASRTAGSKQRLVAFVMEDGIARQGNMIEPDGVVTSGTMSPSLGVGIGLAYVAPEQAVVGTSLQIDVRGKMRSATVREKPLYRKDT